MLTSLYTPTLKQDTDNYLVQRRNLEALCDVVFGPVPVEMVPNCENILEEGNQHFALEEFIARVVDLINELGTKTYFFSQVYQVPKDRPETEYCTSLIVIFNVIFSAFHLLFQK